MSLKSGEKNNNVCGTQNFPSLSAPSSSNNKVPFSVLAYLLPLSGFGTVPQRRFHKSSRLDRKFFSSNVNLSPLLATESTIKHPKLQAHMRIH